MFEKSPRRDVNGSMALIYIDSTQTSMEARDTLPSVRIGLGSMLVSFVQRGPNLRGELLM